MERPPQSSEANFPPGYRDWKLISVAHVGGNLNDLRVKLGNDVAIKAHREEKLPFPGDTIIARLAWRQVTSEENQQSPSPYSRAPPLA
jgi:Cytochrome P460